MNDEPYLTRPPAALRMGRRSLLQRAGLVGAALAGVHLTGCADGSAIERTRTVPTSPEEGGRQTASAGPGASSGGSPGKPVLVVYFSRAGENYFDGGRRFLDVGNTQVVAEMIRVAIGADVFRIEPADPYSDSYDETVARNVREQDVDARPVIANPLPNVDAYDTVLLGSGIWNVRPPMIMSTFLDAVDLTGKRLEPFVTYAVSGLGRTIDVYTSLAPGATIGEGLAVRGEEVAEARDDVEAWLRRLGLLPAEPAGGDDHG